MKSKQNHISINSSIRKWSARQCSAPGKLIVMGEHAVLHGYPSIIAAVDKRISATILPREDNKIILRSDEMGEFSTTVSDIQTVATPKEWLFVLSAIRSVSPQSGFNLHIQSDFSSTIGFGSSAAVTVATLGALIGSASQEELFDRAYNIIYTAQGKKGSGADIAASIYGGVLYYKQGKLVDRIATFNHGLSAVYAGYKTPTPEVIDLVKSYADKDPEKYQKLYAEIGELVEQGWQALKENNLIELGKLFNRNHNLLQQLGVSDETLDDIFFMLNQDKNILGAKISGSGLGDCVVGLGSCPQIDGYDTTVVNVAKEGVRFDVRKQDIVDKILEDKKDNKPNDKGEAYAPVNFALIKYWGKDKKFEQVMLPLTSHLSVSMKHHMGTKTILTPSVKDVVFLNGEKLDAESKFHKKAFAFIDLFRDKNLKIKIETENTVPTGAGLASSASGFAALALALDDFYGWELSKEQLSILARLGSGSASRSVYETGFVEFVRGTQEDTLDSVAIPFKNNLQSLYVGLLIFHAGEKKISSSIGMKETVEKSNLYKTTWEKQVATDLADIKKALEQGSFNDVGRIAQRNALAMHATTHDAGVTYSSEETFKHIEKLLELQKQGVPLYFTQDAGPNLKLLAENSEIIKKYYPEAPIYSLL